MAPLTENQRQRIWRGIMSYWSLHWEAIPINKQDLKEAVDATDTWIDDNQASYNAALPLAARNNLSQAQKTLLFCAVALMRVSAAFLKTIFGD